MLIFTIILSACNKYYTLIEKIILYFINYDKLFKTMLYYTLEINI